MGYFAKMRGAGSSPPGVGLSEIAWSFAGAFLGIGCVAGLNQLFFAGTRLMLVMAPFGASAVLLYGAVKSPLAQPRNAVGGHVISAFIGVLSYKLLAPFPWLASALAVSAAIAAMHATRTLHPPGGATALLAVIGGEPVHRLGFLFVLAPALAGISIMIAIACLVNNIPETRKYPEFWI